MIEETELKIYTDGSQFSNPRQGGVGIVFVTVDERGDEQREQMICPGYKYSTNNEMELQAPLLALKETLKRDDLGRFQKLIIFSDSTYVVNNYDNARFNWARNNWRNRDGRPISSADIWKDLLKQVKNLYQLGIICNFKWIKGHSKNEFNKEADRLAKQSAKNPLNDPIHIQSVRKKRLPGTTEQGSVKLSGQRLQVGILSVEKLPMGRGYKHRYQVLSKRSEFYKKIDWIYTDSFLVCDGHCYNVRVNDENKYPKILKVFSEFDFKTGKKINAGDKFETPSESIPPNLSQGQEILQMVESPGSV